MSWKNNLRKANLRKSDYDIKWDAKDYARISVKNVPNGVEYTEQEITRCIVNGSFSADVRYSGVKSVGSHAISVELDFDYITFKEGDAASDDKTVTYELKFDADELEDDMPSRIDAFNPSEVNIDIDMKNQTDSDKFEISGNFEWQGSY